MNQQNAYAKEFDEIVNQYIMWLNSSENPKVQRKNMWRAFFQGMGSVLDIFGTSSTECAGYNHPVYSRTDLTPAQKDAIAFASDWQRVDRTLDKIISGDSSNGVISIEDAAKGKALVQQMYESFRNVYVANATY